MSDPGMPALDASVIISAHNESSVIARLLDDLEPDQDIEVLVVCNGCTDDTAAVARSVSSSVRVIEIERPSKQAAMAAGRAASAGSRRVYADADIQIDRRSLENLLRALDVPGVLAAAPTRRLDLRRSSWIVRRYYSVWTRLPQVQDGLYGRGVIALDAAGQARVDRFPALMSDDLVMSEAFSPQERQVVGDAVVGVTAPATTADLLRRRIRVVTGNIQADRSGIRRASSKTGIGMLIGMIRGNPTRLADVAVFVVVTLIARHQARRRVAAGDFSTWLRDDSSRRLDPDEAPGELKG